jgi:hypothetical protein
MLEVFSMIGLDNEYEWREAFSVLGLDPAAFGRAATFDAYVSSLRGGGGGAP